MPTPLDDNGLRTTSDAARAVRYMAVKAAVFIAIPLLTAVAAALWVLQ